MYKRSVKAIIETPPPEEVCFMDLQFGKAKYYTEVSGTITTRIDAGGCWYVQVED